MDFLEIRRKAKERAAARAAAAAGPAPAGPADGPGAPAPPASPAPPLALDPVPLPQAGGPRPHHATLQEEVEPPSPPARPGPPRVVTGADPDALAEEAARIEAALAERLESLPAAPDGRFKTWRPEGDEVPDVAPVTPEAAPGEPVRQEAVPPRRPDGDPLDDFFFRDDETGPALVGLAPQAAPPAAAEQVERVEYLTFRLGAEEYGVEIERVREVMRSPPITEVPRAPAGVLGVITVRGEVVAVFDPRARLGLPPGTGSETGRVVIVDDGGGPCGLLVDAVSSVVRLPRGSIEPCPQGIGGQSADCLAGIGRDEDRLFTLLELGALLRPRRPGEGRG